MLTGYQDRLRLGEGVGWDWMLGGWRLGDARNTAPVGGSGIRCEVHTDIETSGPTYITRSNNAVRQGDKRITARFSKTDALNKYDS
jgi:hypothetical protein